MAITIEEHASTADRRLFNIIIHGDYIEVTVTASTAAVDDWINFTREIHPMFHRNVVGLGVAGIAQAQTLNLCVRNRCLIFQLIQSPDVPVSLRDFLMDREHIFVGFRNFNHRFLLFISTHRLHMLRDPVEMLNFYEFEDRNLNFADMMEMIARDCSGNDDVRMSMEVARSDWAVQRLENEQVQQAAFEAYVAFSCGLDKRVWRRFPWI